MDGSNVVFKIKFPVQRITGGHEYLGGTWVLVDLLMKFWNQTFLVYKLDHSIGHLINVYLSGYFKVRHLE